MKFTNTWNFVFRLLPVIVIYVGYIHFCFCRGGWPISEADRQYLEVEYDDYNATNASGPAFCHSTILILMVAMLLRHASSVPESDGGDGDDDASTFLSVSGTSKLC
ncbi:putative E3 ubiquitin-protein ligase MARCH [Helianthus anomalus]